MDHDDKHQRFLEWFLANGGKYGGIDYPSYFEPTHYVGLSASQPLPRNKVILAVPKHIIISIKLAHESPLAPILDKYEIFQGEDNDDKDFNILTLFLIHHTMLGQKSFFYPYLQCITLAETMVHWSSQEIIALDQPYLNLAFIEQVKRQFQPTYTAFEEIAKSHKDLFPQTLTKKIFYDCYGMTMTRCFGWGLPETMMVPFADFMNHHSEGVNHYTFSSTLEGKDHKDYIKKMKALDLSLLGIDNQKMIPIGYEKDSRQKFVEENKQMLKELQIPMTQEVQKMSRKEFNTHYNTLRSMKLLQSYDNQTYPSSQSEDNDTNSDSSQDEAQDQKWGIEGLRYLRTKRFLTQLFSVVKKNKEEEFNLPRPQINRQFDQEVKFQWWNSQSDSHFIVATQRPIDKGEQIYNSYGRRNNRFLLLWYGFTFEGNKYDSVPFRVWAQRIEQCTGQFIFTRFITDVDWKGQIPLGNQRYPYTYLSPQFRLKKTEADYCLLAFFRYRIIKKEKTFAILRNRYAQLDKIIDLQVEVKALEFYKKVLFELIKRYGLAGQKDFSCLKGQRQVFASILTQSNAQIISQHCHGVSMMLKMVEQLKKDPKLNLLKTYQQEWKGQKQVPILIVKSRAFLKHYFKLLEQYQKLS